MAREKAKEQRTGTGNKEQRTGNSPQNERVHTEHVNISLTERSDRRRNKKT